MVHFFECSRGIFVDTQSPKYLRVPFHIIRYDNFLAIRFEYDFKIDRLESCSFSWNVDSYSTHCWNIVGTQPREALVTFWNFRTYLSGWTTQLGDVTMPLMCVWSHWTDMNSHSNYLSKTCCQVYIDFTTWKLLCTAWNRFLLATNEHIHINTWIQCHGFILFLALQFDSMSYPSSSNHSWISSHMHLKFRQRNALRYFDNGKNPVKFSKTDVWFAYKCLVVNSSLY